MTLIFNFQKKKIIIILKTVEHMDEDGIDSLYPNKNSLIVNCLLVCIQDENNLVKRNAMDLMNQHFKISENLFSEKYLKNSFIITLQ